MISRLAPGTTSCQQQAKECKKLDAKERVKKEEKRKGGGQPRFEEWSILRSDLWDAVEEKGMWLKKRRGRREEEEEEEVEEKKMEEDEDED